MRSFDIGIASALHRLTKRSHSGYDAGTYIKQIFRIKQNHLCTSWEAKQLRRPSPTRGTTFVALKYVPCIQRHASVEAARMDGLLYVQCNNTHVFAKCLLHIPLNSWVFLVISSLRDWVVVSET